MATQLKLNLDIQLSTVSASASTLSDECYTPTPWLEMIRRVLGGIGLDPCTTEDNRTGAEFFYTRKTNGLIRSWLVDSSTPSVFCNPPYSKSGAKGYQELFLRKFWEEFKSVSFQEGITLTLVDSLGNKGTGPVLNRADSLAFPGRINFVGADGLPIGDGNRHGLVFAYFGSDRDRFGEIFSDSCFVR